MPGAGWAPRCAGRSTRPTTWSWSRWSTQGDWLFNVADAGAQVVVDFTRPDVVMDNIRWCIDQGINVRGRHHRLRPSSGWTSVRSWLADKPGVGVVIAPNFAHRRGADDAFAAEAARFFESVEIVELHHPARSTRPQRHRRAHRPADRRRPRRGRARPGARTRPGTSWPVPAGADVDGRPVHAVRLAGLVAHQEVLFGTPGRR